MSEDINSQHIKELLERIEALENRVMRLELRQSGQTGPLSSSRISVPNTEIADLAAGIEKVLEQVGEADVGTIRQQLVKNGIPDSLSRSDINKILYANKTRFEISRQDGVKPFWRLVK